MAEALAAKFRQVRVVDPFDPRSQMGPVAMRRQRDRIKMPMARRTEEGATLVIGGGRPAHLNRGVYIAP